MFSDPKKNVEQLGLLEGMVVADFGAGSGFYAVAAAKAVGETGKVYAIDIQKELLRKIKNEGLRRGFKNLEVLWGDLEKPDGSGLSDASVDVVIVTNVLFQVDDKDALLAEAKRILKPSGRALFVEWKESYGGLGPQEKDVVSLKQTEALYKNAGFVFQKKIEAGEHHYGIIVVKNT